jgi:C_GCAxxG_C_C family probable redox protein
MEKADIASSKMAAHELNCAQSVMSAYADDFGIPSGTALKIAGGFGGGMHLGNICGAITACYMVIGLKHKMDIEKPRENLEIVYALMRELNKQFTELHGSIKCPDLIGYDTGNPEEAAQAKEKGVFSALCPRYVHDAVALLETLI